MEEDVLITGSHQIPTEKVVTTMAKVNTPEVKLGPSAHGKGPIVYTELPPLDSMSIPALWDEYLARLSNHKEMEVNLVSTMHKKHVVSF